MAAPQGVAHGRRAFEVNWAGTPAPAVSQTDDGGDDAL